MFTIGHELHSTLVSLRLTVLSNLNDQNEKVVQINVPLRNQIKCLAFIPIRCLIVDFDLIFARVHAHTYALQTAGDAE